MILLYSWDGDPVLNLDSLTHVDHLLTVRNSGLTSLFSKTLPSYGSYLHCTHNYSQPNNNFFSHSKPALIRQPFLSSYT